MNEQRAQPLAWIDSKMSFDNGDETAAHTRICPLCFIQVPSNEAVKLRLPGALDGVLWLHAVCFQAA